MRSMGWIVASGFLLLISCGPESASPLLLPQTDQESLLDGNRFSVVSHVPGCDLQVDLSRENGQLLVTIVSAAKFHTDSLLFELDYDSAACTPLVVQQSTGLNTADGCLVLESMAQPGTVSAGYVRTDGQNWQLPAGASVAEILFAVEP